MLGLNWLSNKHRKRADQLMKVQHMLNRFQYDVNQLTELNESLANIYAEAKISKEQAEVSKREHDISKDRTKRARLARHAHSLIRRLGHLEKIVRRKKSLHRDVKKNFKRNLRRTTKALNSIS